MPVYYLTPCPSPLVERGGSVFKTNEYCKGEALDGNKTEF